LIELFETNAWVEEKNPRKEAKAKKDLTLPILNHQRYSKQENMGGSRGGDSGRYDKYICATTSLLI